MQMIIGTNRARRTADKCSQCLALVVRSLRLAVDKGIFMTFAEHAWCDLPTCVAIDTSLVNEKRPWHVFRDTFIKICHNIQTSSRRMPASNKIGSMYLSKSQPRFARLHLLFRVACERLLAALPGCRFFAVCHFAITHRPSRLITCRGVRR
jgi:hypothetical protein